MSSKINFKHTSKLLSVLLIAVMLVCMMVMAMVPASADETGNQAVADARDSVMHLQMYYKKGNTFHGIYGGTCFKINDSTILTSAHVISIDAAAKAYCNELEGGAYRESNIYYAFYVNKDVRVFATLKNKSDFDDYAILTFTDTVNKPDMVLGSADDIDVLDTVHALGFPAAIRNLHNTATYTQENITVTSGSVQGRVEVEGTNYIQHGALIKDGNSGGPLVDGNGVVVGISKGVDKATKDYHYAVEIDQVRETLDTLGIEYRTDSTPDPEPVTEAPTQAIGSIDAPTEAPRVDIPVPTEPAAKSDMTKTIVIIAIAALAVILIAVVVVVVISSSKKKNPTVAAGPAPGSMPAGAPARPVPPMAPPAAPSYNRPPMPPQGPAPMAMNDGAGETSVLNEGAGETTVLGGNQATGFVLVRSKGGERININKPEFTIGKERRRVDYCIADNNSISRAHAKIKVRGGKCYIADLGSTNCTYVNGTKLSPNQEVALSAGDKIKFSDEEFEFVG